MEHIRKMSSRQEDTGLQVMGNVWVAAENLGIIDVEVKEEIVSQRAKDLASKTQESGERRGDLT